LAIAQLVMNKYGANVTIFHYEVDNNASTSYLPRM